MIIMFVCLRWASCAAFFERLFLFDDMVLSFFMTLYFTSNLHIRHTRIISGNAKRLMCAIFYFATSIVLAGAPSAPMSLSGRQ